MTTSAYNLARRRGDSISFLLQVGTERNHSSNNCGFCGNKIWKTFISRKLISKYYWLWKLDLTIFLQHKVLWSWSFPFIPLQRSLHFIRYFLLFTNLSKIIKTISWGDYFWKFNWVSEISLSFSLLSWKRKYFSCIQVTVTIISI